MLRSMTGFGRALLETPTSVQQWEIRSVNHRFLDIKWRLPPLARTLEMRLDKIVRKAASRGHLDISLKIQFAQGKNPRPFFNEPLASSMLDCLASLAARRNDVCRPDYSVFMTMPEFWQDNDADLADEFSAALVTGLEGALKNWNESRSAEGETLGIDLEKRFSRLRSWADLIEKNAPAIRADRLKLLRERLNELLLPGQGLDESRFLQEVVILTDRLDVSEELTRLNSHLDRLQSLLKDGGVIGRRLDFTLQECFREINTCGNKIADPEISPYVVDFKNELEKCREQVQNLE